MKRQSCNKIRAESETQSNLGSGVESREVDDYELEIARSCICSLPHGLFGHPLKIANQQRRWNLSEYQRSHSLRRFRFIELHRLHSLKNSLCTVTTFHIYEADAFRAESFIHKGSSSLFVDNWEYECDNFWKKLYLRRWPIKIINSFCTSSPSPWRIMHLWQY